MFWALPLLISPKGSVVHLDRAAYPFRSERFRGCINCPRGVSTTELLVAMLLTSMLLGVAISHLREFLELRRLRSASADWSRVVVAARHWAFSQRQAAWLELHEAGPAACLVLHNGQRGDCGGCGEQLRCRAGAQVLAHSAPLPLHLDGSGTSTSLAWRPGERTVSPTGTLRLSLPDGRALHHVVNLVGRLRVCSPDGLVTGFAPC